MTTYFTNKKYIAPCYYHGDVPGMGRPTLIVHTMHEDICGETYSACWRCWWVDPAMGEARRFIRRSIRRITSRFTRHTDTNNEPF